MDKKRKILITGPLPPPAGGISIHLYRLKQLLDPFYDIDIIDESRSKKNQYFNIRSLNIFRYLSKINQTDLVYVHSGNRLFKKINIFSALLFRKKLIVTIHGYGKKRNRLLKWWDELFFNRADKIVLVNQEIHDKLTLNKKKCLVQHPFLPPVMSQEPPLPPIILDILQDIRKKGKKVICANASRLDTYNGEDLYGLDIALEALNTLNKKGKPFFLIFNVSSLDNGQEKYENAQAFIRQNNLIDSCIVISEKISFVKLIEQSDLVIRPTNTDGDALTIREAIYLNKKVIASNVVKRPDGTVLFANRDANDLAEKIEMFMSSNLQANVSEAALYKPEPSWSFYQQLLTTTLEQKETIFS